MLVPTATLNELRALYDAGLYYTAWQRSQTLAPLKDWYGPEAQILAGRLAKTLEGDRLGRSLHNRAWRSARRDADAAYYRASNIYGRLGPHRALRFLEKLPAFPDATAEMRSNLLSLRASALATYRDFSRAHALLDEAIQLDSKNAWLWVERAHVHERADDYPAALKAAEHGLELRPYYRPAVQSAAHLLMLLSRDEDALTLLREADARIESPDVTAQLAALLFEHEKYEEALASWRRYREIAPLLEQAGTEWWHARMSDIHYQLGNLKQSAEHARLAKNGFHEQIAERLAVPPAGARIVMLAVPFVRQHDMTCAPATLSAISQYWRAPVDHLALARRICYNGTQSHMERHWAEESGFVVRQFTVTWECATALLDRGVPFALATVETRSAHLQAIVGYDGIRGTLYIRDPFLKHHSEAIGSKWLEGYAFCGPRGTLFLPAAEAHRLEGLELPDAALYDLLHRVERSLFLHDRATAAEALGELEKIAPAHVTTFQGRREMAWYDGSQPRALAITEEWLARFSTSNCLRWARYIALRDLARNTDRLTALRELATGEKAEPVFWRELGEELRPDARQRPLARRWMLRALRAQPCEAEFLHCMAGLLWDEHRLPEALELYRRAASLRDKVDYPQRSWFLAARHLRQEKEVLGVLRTRAREQGARSSQPGMTLHWALLALGQSVEAFAALDAAIDARPDDGDLLTFAADAHARHGQSQRAGELLARAEGKCARATWLRTSATLADYRGALAEALGVWREILAAEPLSFDAIQAVTRLTAEVESRAAALAFLRGTVDRFPHHCPIRRLLVEWLRDESTQARETALRELIALEPADAWAERELALAFAGVGRYEEALAHCANAVTLEPQSATTHSVRGRVLLLAGRLAEASTACREALRRDVDDSAATANLLAACSGSAEKKEALAFLLAELEHQTVFGSGLLSYRDAAFPILEPEELLQNLREGHRQRPDLWHAWSALIACLSDTHRAAEALPLAREAVERFPLNARLWHDLSCVYSEQVDFKAEAEALCRARELSPAWGQASRDYADCLTRLERYDEALRVLEEAIAASPLDPVNRGHLAHLLWRRSRNPRAVEVLVEALRVEPGYLWAWDSLRDWASDGRAVALAEELTKTRGGEPDSWIRLAEMLPDDKLEERLAALGKALALNPRLFRAHDFRAWLLTQGGRYEEATAACAPAVYLPAIPRELRARAAWVQAMRGNLPGALAKMREVTETDPDYYWAWECLADWCDRLGDHKAERDAAEKMARLQPRNAIPLGYLANAEKKLGNHDAALKVHKQAFALDPSYAYAGFNIFGAHLKKKELKAAAETLVQLKKHLPGADTTAAEVRLLAAREERDAALAAFQPLLTVPERDVNALNAGAYALRQAGWTKQLEKLLASQLDRKDLNPAAARNWVICFTARRRWGQRRRLLRLDPALPITLPAWREFAEICGESKKPQYLRRMRSLAQPYLARDVVLWGSIGFAFCRSDQHRATLRWLQDWRQRKDITPWILSNVVASLHALGREAEALEASRLALTLKHDHTSAQHALWLAIDEVSHGNFAAARSRLKEMTYAHLSEFSQSQWILTDAACTVAEAQESDRRSVYRVQLTRLRSPAHAALFKDRAFKHALPRTVAQMARTAQLFAPALRGWWFRLLGAGKSTRLVTPALFVVILAASILIKSGTDRPGSFQPTPLPTAPAMRHPKASRESAEKAKQSIEQRKREAATQK